MFIIKVQYYVIPAIFKEEIPAKSTVCISLSSKVTVQACGNDKNLQKLIIEIRHETFKLKNKEKLKYACR